MSSCFCLLMVGSAVADPGAHWQAADPAADPWAADVSRDLDAYGQARHPTAVMVVHDDRVVAHWGDVALRVNVRSVRKSLLGALLGVAVADGTVRLSSTLAELGIDDTAPGLTAAEKQATVRDLLMARSGVYHAAAYETSEMRQNRPARGSHPAGDFWFYNNWDFNALGTVYRRATGEDVFDGFLRRIARPIGMEDFSPRDGRYVRDGSSAHPAYTFSMSARDLARFGSLYRDGGRWGGSGVVPTDWVGTSTVSHSQTDRPGRGYGYLWWTLPPAEWGRDAFMASGYGGQVVLVAPAKHLVLVETAQAGGIRTSSVLDLARTVARRIP